MGDTPMQPYQQWSFWEEKNKNTIRMSNSSDPDQARRFVGPDLGPNCLQKLSAGDTSR